jgi:hypothetical protein
MNRLLEIGFQKAGEWVVEGDKLKALLTRHATQTNVLYSFVCDGEVKYIGKTVSPLASRMAGYRTPGKTQTTNIRNNNRIKALLAQGAAVEIYALPDNGLLHYGRFHINLAAGLEDDLIRVIDPEWNGGRKEPLSETATSTNPRETVSQESVASFTFMLPPTYFKSGFFNVGVAAERLLGSDGEVIELFVGNAAQPILGTINRRANTNGTPRVMGGTGLRDWFQVAASVMDLIAVEVMSPTAIRLQINSTNPNQLPE